MTPTTTDQESSMYLTTIQPAAIETAAAEATRDPHGFVMSLLRKDGARRQWLSDAEQDHVAQGAHGKDGTRAFVAMALRALTLIEANTAGTLAEHVGACIVTLTSAARTPSRQAIELLERYGKDPAIAELARTARRALDACVALAGTHGVPEDAREYVEGDLFGQALPLARAVVRDTSPAPAVAPEPTTRWFVRDTRDDSTDGPYMHRPDVEGMNEREAGERFRAIERAVEEHADDEGSPNGFPSAVADHDGRVYHFTGKRGRHLATGRPSREYAHQAEGDRRVWALADGRIVEDDTGPVPVRDTITTRACASSASPRTNARPTRGGREHGHASRHPLRQVRRLPRSLRVALPVRRRPPALARRVLPGVRPRPASDHPPVALADVAPLPGLHTARRRQPEDLMNRPTVALIRVSTEDQRNGPDAQRHELAAYAERAGLDVVAWVEEHVSGRLPMDKRPALAEALSLIADGTATVLLVKDRTRYARDATEAGIITREVQRHGAAVESADGIRDDGTPTGKFVTQVMDAASEHEVAMIRLRTSAALQAMKRRGRRVGSIPYGFQLAADGLHLVEHDQEQATVALAAVLRARGLSLRAVGRELVAQGHSPRRGGSWNPNQVRRLVAVAA
jgi:DNA invertase Pin-like site-specific DNA recombinase